MSNSLGTSQTTSGPNESSAPPQPSVEQRLEQLDKALDDFERPLGIPGVSEDEVTKESRRILSLSPSVLRKLTAIECVEAAFILGQYAHRLQQAVNREQARVDWAEESIKKIIARTINNYKGISYEERKMQAVRDNDAASKLDTIRVKAKLRIDRVSYLANKADNMIKALMSLKNAKSGRSEE